MEELESCCEWHCSCKTLLGKRPVFTRVITPFSDRYKRLAFLQQNSRSGTDGNSLSKDQKVTKANNLENGTEEFENLSNGTNNGLTSNGTNGRSRRFRRRFFVTPVKRRPENPVEPPASVESCEFEPVLVKEDEVPQPVKMQEGLTKEDTTDKMVDEQKSTVANVEGIESTTFETLLSSDPVPALMDDNSFPNRKVEERVVENTVLPPPENGNVSKVVENTAEEDIMVPTEEQENPDIQIDAKDANVNGQDISPSESTVDIPEAKQSEPEATESSSTPSTSNNTSSAYNCRNRSQFHKCGSCGKMFGLLSSLKRHEKEHLLESSKHCECVECGKSYTTLASYQRHLKSHTKCLLCGKAISKAEKERQTARDGLEVNVCGKCRKRDLISSKRNKRDFDATGDSDYSDSESNSNDNGSDMTDGSLEDMGIYNVSSLEDPEVPKSPLTCNLCGKRLVTLKNLNLHLEWHKSARIKNTPKSGSESRCRYCREPFPNSALMKKHEATVHLADRPLKCSYCEARFKEKHHRARHEEKMH